MFKSSCPSSAAAGSSSSMLQTRSQKDEVKYKGVRKRKWGKWVSEIRLPNSRERIWLGSYDSSEKAARAFDAALFCLRGKNAKFNFPDNPPDDLVGGRSLTPAEIQVVASQYANGYNHEQQLQQLQEEGLINEKEDDIFQSQMMDLSEDTSPISSNSDGAFRNMDTINWSFLDLPEPNGPESGNVPDYGLMLSSLDNMHEDMYMTPHLGTKVDDMNIIDQHGDDQNVDENYSHQSFLWNF